MSSQTYTPTTVETAMASGMIFPPWDIGRWTDVDDRVRGGSSISHIDEVELDFQSSAKSAKGARFWGHLDIDTLGGAGFASQRYRFGPEPLHLPPLEYNGITVNYQPDTTPSSSPSSIESTENANVNANRANTFTLVLKCTLPTRPPSKPKTPPQPEPSSLSYEANWTVDPALLPDNSTTTHGSQSKVKEVKFKFQDFKATYRGREVKRDDPMFEPLHPEKIYEMSIMCRSAFGDQKGDFGVIITSIKGWKKGAEEVKNQNEIEKEKDKEDRQAGQGVVRFGGEQGKSAIAAGLGGVVSALYATWKGMIAWVYGFFSGHGGIVLRDEEKDPLI